MSGETGRAWKVYYNTGTYGSPTWTEITEAQDVSIGLTKEEIEVRRRGAEFVEYLKGYKECEITFPMNYSNGNTNMVALKDDFFADDADTFDLLILDGSQGTSGSQGIRAMVALFGMPITASLGAEQTTVEFTFKPAYSSDGETDWHTVA